MVRPDGLPALDHVTIVATDVASSMRFYDAALGALGMVRVAEFGDEEEDQPDIEAAGWGVAGGQPMVWVVAGLSPTRGVHLSLSAPGREDVERFHAAALSAGGTSRSVPRRWAVFRRGEFSAAVLDPDGNLIEVSAPE